MSSPQLRLPETEFELAKLRAYYDQIVADESVGLNRTQIMGVNCKTPHLYFAGGNQIGKSTMGRWRATRHLTGDYPDWYKGPRYTKPVTMIMAGKTAVSTRNVLCFEMLGKPGEYGTGTIPMKDLVDVKHLGGAVPGQVDYFLVRHYTNGVYDGNSICHVFYYTQGIGPMMGIPAHHILVDEEPKDQEIYSELTARLMATEGTLDICATPLNGWSTTYNAFANDQSGLRTLITYSVDDATHHTAEWIQRQKDIYAHDPQRQARLYGIPTIGDSGIYTFDDEDLLVDDFDVPRSWGAGIGLDFPHTTGHFAAALGRKDPAADCIYVPALYKQDRKDASYHASRTIGMGGNKTWCFWPKDGHVEMGGQKIRDTYEELGLKMYPEYAHYELDGGGKTNSLEAVIAETTLRMATDRLKFFRSCADPFLKEKSTYRQKDGKVVPRQNDHVIDAVHKLIMMERFMDQPGHIAHRPVYVRPTHNFYGGRGRRKRTTGANKWRS